jgi:predicted RNase H-like HicB family nuclease
MIGRRTGVRSSIAPGVGIPVSGDSKMPIGTFTAVLHKEGDLYVADCPEVGTVSQGKTVEEAIANLKEATELYMEEFPPQGSSRPLVTVFEARYA